MCTELHTKAQCAEAVEKLLARGVRRFLATDDALCLHTLDVLKENGFDTLRDIQLASLIDSDGLKQAQIPALEFDAAELGRIACRELLHHLANEPFHSAPLLGYRIIQR